MTKETHRFDVYTRSNPDGDDVGAEDARILDSGVLVFFNHDRIDVAYAPGEWTRFEYGYKETGDDA